MVTQTIDINLVPGISAPVANVSQYDVGRQITFNLYNGTEAYTPTAGAVIVCNGTKSNGTGFASSTTWSGNVVTVTTDAQMTDFAGISRCELVITVGSVRVGTANFLMKVEQAGVSEDTEFDPAQIAYVADALATLGSTESIYNTLNARIDNIVAPSGDPTLTEVADARYSALTEETYASLTSRILADDEYVDDKIGALASLDTEDKTSIVAAINELVASQNSGLTDSIKTALLNCFQHVAWIDENGQTYYDALYDALYEVTAIALNTYSISMSTLGSTTQLTATTTPEGAAVTWESSDTSIATVDSTGLVTSVAYGSATITATAGNATASCAVTVAQATVVSITATYTQSGTVYDTDSLDSLKSDLVVRASWTNGTTTTVASADYVLSGTLSVGTSTITVSYGGVTATFNVTVTAGATPIYDWDLTSSLTDSVGSVTASTNATFTEGTGLVFNAQNQYCDFGAVQSTNRTYEIDVAEIGTCVSGGNRRLLMFDTDTNTSSGGSGLICVENGGGGGLYGWKFYLGTGWDSNLLVEGSAGDTKHEYFNGKTVKIFLDSNRIATVSMKNIGASDRDYSLVGSSAAALSAYTNGHVYIGSSNIDYFANATITGLRIYEGEK